MIVCPRCSKENQDHYKFCLGCGAELPREAAQPKSFSAPTPPAGVPAAEEPATQPTAAPPAPAPAPEPAAPAGPTPCPNCSAEVPPNFKFCGACGFDMTNARGATPAPAAPAPAPAAAPAADTGARLTLIRPDGTEGESFPLNAGATAVGRDAAGPFATDTYLSPVHANFELAGGQLTVTDANSLNGVYVRIPQDTPYELTHGTIFRIGQEILRFDALPEAALGGDGTEVMGSPNPGYLGRISLVIGRESMGNAYCIPDEGMHLGRERGDVIFPDDGYVSGLHCRLHGEGGRVYLTDLGSSNGTFLRIEAPTGLPTGSLLLMGQQLFRAEY